MRICTVYIEEYGALRDKRLELSNGLNLLTGENESGKSTVCAFIKFVLYGHMAKERSAHASAVSGISSGYLTLLHSDEKVYRITRREVGSRSKVTVFCETDVTEISSFGVPGEYFLGIPSELYTRSVFISQKENDELDKKSSDAVTNLLTSGSDTTNVKRAKDRLTDKRRSYKLDRGVGGVIGETETLLSEKKRELSEAVRKKQLSGEIADKIAETEKALIRLEKEIRLEKHRKILEIKRESEQLKSELQKVNASRSDSNGALNTEYIRTLRSLSHDCDMARQNASVLSSTPRLKPTAPSGYEYFGAVSADELKAKWRLSVKWKNSLTAMMLSSFAVAVSLFALSVISLIIAIFGVPFCVLGIVLAVMRKKALNSLQFKALDEIDALFASFEKYEAALASYEELDGKIKSAEAEAEKTEAKLKAELQKSGMSCLDDAESAYDEQLRTRNAEDARRFDLTARLENAEGRLSTYSDGEIASALEAERNSELDAPTGSVSGTSLEMLLQLLNMRKKESADLREELARFEGETPIDTAVLAIEVEELQERLALYTKEYDAVRLAISTLEEAERAVRGQFIPQISAIGGGYFEKITENRYASLSLNSEFGVSCSDSDGTPTRSEHFSGGSYALAWFCLRLALCERLSEGTPLPLILDEPFVYYDGARLTHTLSLLSEIAESGTQVLLFSASDREKRVLGEKVNLIEL